MQQLNKERHAEEGVTTTFSDNTLEDLRVNAAHLATQLPLIH